MNEQQTLAIINQIFQAVFQQDSPYSLAQIKDKFAFDIALPTKVKDSMTGETTYTSMPNAERYITQANSRNRDGKSGWLRPKQPIKSLKELLALWEEINLTTTERAYDSENVTQSDPIYSSQNVYCSTDCGQSKSIIFCDGTYRSEFALACQRSNRVNFCIRVDDSNTCTNSYNVICSGKISNSFFIQDCSDLHECLFCSHISNHEFCIANMQFEKEEYYAIKQQVIAWLLSDAKAQK